MSPAKARRRRLVSIPVGICIVLGMVLGAALSAAMPLSSDQQRCVVKLNAAAARAERAQAKETRRCLSRAFRGRESDAQACIGEDQRGRLGRASARAQRVDARHCVGTPPLFAYTGAAAVVSEGFAASRGLTEDLFGSDLGAAAELPATLRGREDAACQGRVARRSDGVVDALFAVANRAKRDALRDAIFPIGSGAELAARIGEALADDSRGAASRAGARLRDAANAKCTGADLAALFPGLCLSAADPGELSSCAEEHARCRFCQALEAFDGLDLGCELFDDGADNASCGGEPPPPPERGPVVHYDRTDHGQLAPLPDDYWVVDDAATRTGQRVEIEVPDREDDVRTMLGALISYTEGLDGFSPVGPVSLTLSEAAAPASLPRTQLSSLDTQANVRLYDLTPGSADFGELVPFGLWSPSFAYPGQEMHHGLVLFPALPLTPGGRYGLVVTRGLRTAAGNEPFGPSAFFEAALAPPEPGEDAAVTRVRELAADVLDVLAQASPPLAAEDVALVLRLSVRSTDDIPHDPLHMREQVHALPPPAVAITDVRSGTGSVAAIVTGEFESPLWLNPDFMERDLAGDPVIVEMQTIPFTLALPVSAADAPAPITMVQHGSPGSSEGQVPAEARTHLAAGGFAAIGMTDYFNRHLGQDWDAHNYAVFFNMLSGLGVVGYWAQITGEQLAFLRAIGQLGDLDVLPLGSPDGVPDIDPNLPLTYLGQSAGAISGQGLLPYAPEIRAASLAAGAVRHTLQFVHLDELGTTDFFRREIADYVPNLTPPDMWASFPLMQMGLDRQDMHNHAAFMYSNPIEIDGTTRKASVAVVEGLRDSSQHNLSTRSLAWTIGSGAHLEPVRQASPILTPTAGPLTANIDAETTAGFTQFVPDFYPGLDPTPGCVGMSDGHDCATLAKEPSDQRILFFQSALTDPAPTLIHPEAGP